jgi:hypothetical protein
MVTKNTGGQESKPQKKGKDKKSPKKGGDKKLRSETPKEG